jgi:hypothetical protein
MGVLPPSKNSGQVPGVGDAESSQDGVIPP